MNCFKCECFFFCRPTTDNFTQVIVDGNNRIGCMCLKYESASRFFTSWLCDFGRRAIEYFPVYDQLATGQTPGQGCKTGTHSKYTSLCSDKEPIDLNAIDWSRFNVASYSAHLSAHAK